MSTPPQQGPGYGEWTPGASYDSYDEYAGGGEYAAGPGQPVTPEYAAGPGQPVTPEYAAGPGQPVTPEYADPGAPGGIPAQQAYGYEAPYYAGEPAAGPDYGASYGYAPEPTPIGVGDGSPYGDAASYAADPGVADYGYPPSADWSEQPTAWPEQDAWDAGRHPGGADPAWDDVDAAALPIPAPSPPPEAESLPKQEKPSLRDLVPIWHPPGLVPAALTGGVAALLAVTALAGGPVAVGGVFLLQLLTAAGWFRLHGMWPARQGIAIGVLAGIAADAAVLAGGDHAVRVLPGVLAGVLALALVQQLVRRDGRPELLPALTVTASAGLLAALDVLYVVAADLEGPGVRDGAAVVVAVAAVAVAVLAAALPVPGVVGHGLGLALAAGVGVVGGSAVGLGSSAVVLGAGAGLLGLMGRRVAGYDHPSRFVHMTAGVALPLALAAPTAYLLGRVVIG
ncbi:hypothetical protein ACPA54_12405 [Uniformispora flossi]|uniref:hypothetical protein n=1 Tax=Uniformispora flossi TaxID=3390723 RepID=UPI003C2E86D1